MTDKPPTLRQRQAQLTRDEILGSARRLFAEHGYSRTSVRDIAQAAGVSAQTVYDSIGTKQALVARLNDLIRVEAQVPAIVGASIDSPDPKVVAATSSKVTRSILENCADIIHALVTGASAEPELALVREEGHRRHIDGAKLIVSKLQALGALDETLEPGAAADTLAAISDGELALLLRDAYGWSLDRIESWIADTACALLLK
jgi:AcrR family transcriptional regulator